MIYTDKDATFLLSIDLILVFLDCRQKVWSEKIC
jgi:hypothetical protein